MIKGKATIQLFDEKFKHVRFLQKCMGLGLNYTGFIIHHWSAGSIKK